MHLSLSTALGSASRCSRPLSTAYGRNASFALGARLSCSHVLSGGLRPSPSFQLPTILGCLAPLALVAAPLTREAAASTAARNVGISVGVGDGDVGNCGASGVGGVGDGGACVGGIGSACGAGGVCDGGVAGCFARGVCGGVAGGPSWFSSISSAMVVESKPDVELPTAPFWSRYVNFEPLFGWRQPLQRCLQPTATMRRSLSELASRASTCCSSAFGPLLTSCCLRPSAASRRWL